MTNPEDLKKKLNEFIADWCDKEAKAASQNKPLPQDKSEFIKSKLGYPGIMISGSKQARKTKDGREHLAVFNANLIVEGYGKVWFGDIDVTADEKELQAIAKELQAKVYVLREMDARFGTEFNPNLDQAVYVTDGVTSEIKNPLYAQYYERDVKGKIFSRKDNR